MLALRFIFQSGLPVKFTIITLILAATLSHAEPISVRWTKANDTNAEFLHVVETLNKQTGLKLSASDFLLVEDRTLATSNFKMFVQMAAGIPINQRSIRLWSDLKNKELIQAEALVENGQHIKNLEIKMRFLTAKHKVLQSGQSALALAKNLIRKSEDPQYGDLQEKRFWENGQLVRVITAKAQRGVHTIKVLFETGKVINSVYREYPQSDADDEFSIPALVYPIYEETENQKLQSRVFAQLKYLKKSIHFATDAYQPLRYRHYLGTKQDPILGLTLQGQADGFWAMSDLKSRAAAIYSGLPLVSNSFANGLVLEGRFATVNIHPEAFKVFSGIQFSPRPSAVFRASWQPTTASDDWDSYELVPSSAVSGKPLTYFEEAFNRPARRLANHNAAEYINDGFDEIQVYFAINTLFENLRELGFVDPELSTRPFHAFLYNPDLGAKDNAFYTDDTINFTTYSSHTGNMARDNSTIWHELGHGIMDRLMGDSVSLSDTGGLSEGMADFIAALVIEKVTRGQPFDGHLGFRIVNTTGFSLTNESHDDGEAYGGTLRDLMVAAKNKYGADGITKVGDLTMETMRLCRNHPGITAEVWFNHLLFADEIGHLPVRAPGELKDLILSALASRNFTLDGKNRADFKITYNGNEVNEGSPGSRSKPVRLSLGTGEKATYQLQINVSDGVTYQFKYPLKVRVQLQNGPLQGALHWDGEESTFVDYTLSKPGEALNINLSISDKCDWVNRPDGSCNDFAYIHLLPEGAKTSVAKKRFYLRLMPKK
jgi:hypothetical protein